MSARRILPLTILQPWATLIAHGPVERVRPAARAQTRPDCGAGAAR